MLDRPMAATRAHSASAPRRGFSVNANAMIKAIARAFRWREMLEGGTYATIAEIASAETINESHVGRVLRLTLLAPDTAEAIMGGRQPADVTLAVLMKPFAVEWAEQRRTNSSWRSDASVSE